MNRMKKVTILPLIALLLLFGAMPADAVYRQQCPADNPAVDADGDGNFTNDTICMQLGSGDGFATMADGRPLYIFGFSRYGGLYTPTDTPPDPTQVGEMWDSGGLILGANFPAPAIEVPQGKDMYMNLHNVGMLIRPDLFDPHTFHYHGFPNVASVFDGLPDSAISINMGSTLTYFWHHSEPGTYMYHCHVEATEHMQMGMLGTFYVTPLQDKVPVGTNLNGYTHQAGDRYVYNDGDGGTRYDVVQPLQILSFDPNFHDANETVQPLPFADMHDVYPMLNGRGYPDTVNAANILNGEGHAAQDMNSAISATAGQKILLRISSLATVDYYTLSSPSIPMSVVGNGAKIMRGSGDAAGLDLAYKTNSITLGGGESKDVILDTTGVPAGTYFLFSRNLHQLSNNQEDFGGMMTEIVISN